MRKCENEKECKSKLSAFDNDVLYSICMGVHLGQLITWFVHSACCCLN
jgi:hypothetical protein